MSSPVKLICGVPHGSLLVPLLFVLYAADVLIIAQSHGVRIHDLQTYISSKLSTRLQPSVSSSHVSKI